METIRVAQIVGKWVGGGVESVVMNYYRNIDHSKIQFDFLVDEDSVNIPYDEIESMGGRVIIIPPYQKIFKYHRELKKVLKDGNYKIVHSHINTLSVFSLWAAKCAGVPIRISHSHSTTNAREKKKNLLKQVLKKFSRIFPNEYMCCSELAGRWLFGNKMYDNGQIFLLNNAVDLQQFEYNEKLRKTKRAELKIPENTLVIGNIGRFVTQKNHEYLIDIFYEIHKNDENTILCLAGSGPLQEKIKEKAKKLQLEDSIKFLGQVDKINEIYQVFDVFVLPSLYEGLPVVAIEAQGAGLLCVLSDEMTKETKILDTTFFMSINKEPKEWANEIIEKSKNYLRKISMDEMSQKGFNIKEESKKLSNYYIEKLEKYGRYQV